MLRRNDLVLQKRAILEADEWAHILQAQEQLLQAKGRWHSPICSSNAMQNHSNVPGKHHCTNCPSAWKRSCWALNPYMPYMVLLVDYVDGSQAIIKHSSSTDIYAPLWPIRRPEHVFFSIAIATYNVSSMPGHQQSVALFGHSKTALLIRTCWMMSSQLQEAHIVLSEVLRNCDKRTTAVSCMVLHALSVASWLHGWTLMNSFV